MELGLPTEKRFTWVLDNFSPWYQTTRYSHGFAVAGCNWRLSAHSNVYSNGDYLSVYLELAPGSPPPGWRRNVQFTFTLVNKLSPTWNKVSGGECCFDAKTNTWGFSNFLPLYKLRDRSGGFLVDGRLVIIAQVHVLLATVWPVEPVKITYASVTKSQVVTVDGDAFQVGADDDDDDDDDGTSQVAQETKNASNENVDDDEEEGANDDDDDDDASSPASVDENDGKEDVYDEAASLVTNDNATNGTSLDQVKSSEDASQTVENGDKGFDTVAASVTETCNNVLGQEIQPVKETMDVNGFEVLASQVESVRLIFERHPDISAEFRAKNQRLRNACMSFLLSLIGTLCQSLEELSNDDLAEADIALAYLKDAGFKVNWLEKKLDQLKENKEKEKSGLVRVQEIEENLLKLKQMWSHLDDLAEKEKSELSATRTALSFDDIV